MNIDKLNELIDHLETLPDDEFDLSEYHVCGSPSCVAGWAAWLSLGKPENLIGGLGLQWPSHSDVTRGIVAEALGFLEVSDHEEQRRVEGRLFAGDFGRATLVNITKAQVIKALRDFAETKEYPDWDIIRYGDSDEE